MAISDTSYTFIGVPNGYQRDLPFALDRSSIFYSKAEADVYASGVVDKDSRGISGATSYIGQIIAVYTLDTDGSSVKSVAIYKIDADRTLKSLDSMPVDAKSIVVGTDGSLQLYGFAEALNGAQPKVVVDGDNRYISWFIPDTTTMEGVQSALGTAQENIENLQEAVGDSTKGLTKAVADNKTATETNATGITEAKAAAATNAGEITTLKGRMDTAETDIDNLETRAGTIESAASTLKGRVDTAEGEIDALQEAASAVDGKIQTATAGMAHNITYDASALKITIPMKNADGTGEGTALEINLPKDNFVRSGRYDSESQEIVIVLDDDTTVEGTTEVRIPASELVDVYTADNTGLGGVEVAVSAANKISARLVVDSASILSVNAEGKLTIDTTAIYEAIGEKLDASAVAASIGDDADDTTVPTSKATKTYVDTKVGTAAEDTAKLKQVVGDETSGLVKDVNTLNGDATTAGSVAKAVADEAALRVAADEALGKRIDSHESTVTAELLRVDTAHNTLAGNFAAHTHNGTDAPKIAYADLTGAPTALSAFTDDLDLANKTYVTDAVKASNEELTEKVNAKQDTAVTMEKVLYMSNWVQDGELYKYTLDVKYTLGEEAADLPENCIIDIAPKTQADSDACLEAHFSQIVSEDAEATGSVVISASSVPTKDIAVLVNILPSVITIGA